MIQPSVVLPLSTEVIELVRSLSEDRSLFDRVHGDGRRVATLTRIMETHDVRVVPQLLRLFVADENLAPHIAIAIATLLRHVTPVQLSWVDEQVRHGSDRYNWINGWRPLAVEVVPRLARTAEFDASVVGLLTSHADGFVRAAALEVLAQTTSGQELPFLALRVNDWVEQVAERARALLLHRLSPENRHAVLPALPFIVRVLAQHRRDHRAIEAALQELLRSDRGAATLAFADRFDTRTRRKVYELITTGQAQFERNVLDAALNDADVAIRLRALRAVATDPVLADRAEILLQCVRHDSASSVRGLALGALAEHLPEHLGAAFPRVLLDRGAGVRALARFVARTHTLGLVPRAIYIEALDSTRPRELAAAIEGVGETGGPADMDLVTPFLNANNPRVRSSALRALLQLDVARGLSSAVAALGDGSSSVTIAAVRVLSKNARRVDFDRFHRQVQLLSDPIARRTALRVFVEAPKWDAVVFLLDALMDPDDRVRAASARRIENWLDVFNRSHTRPTATQLERISALLDSVASRLSSETLKALRFTARPE